MRNEALVGRSRALCFLAALALTFGWSTIATAGTLTLSDSSSDSTPASLLSATLDFSNPVGSQVTLTVTNDTTAPNEYFINFVYFNVTSDVTGLTLDSVTSSLDGAIGGWSLNTSMAADGFGVFDYELADGQGNDQDQIESGESVAFVFTFTGSNVDMSDFTTELSTIPPGDKPRLAAAKFVRGPGDDSAFGAVVPEPGTFALVAFGLTAMALRRRA